MRTKLNNSTWPLELLGKTVEITKGKKPAVFIEPSAHTLAYLEASFLRGLREARHVPYARESGIIIANESDTLIVWDGNAGDVFFGHFGAVASTMARVRTLTERILPEYLYYFLRFLSPHIKQTAMGTTVKHVRRRVFNESRIPVPPLSVQNHIVCILKAAGIIRRKRRETLQTADAILPAYFVSMFGDPEKPRENLERVKLGDISDLRSGVTKGRKLSVSETVKVPYLCVANVQDGFLDLSEVKTIEVSLKEAAKYCLQYGDVLITEGGDPDKLGRGCIWHNQIEYCIHQNHIFRVRPNPSKLTPEYLAALLRTQYAKRYFLSCAKCSSNLASLNMAQVKAFPIPLPPLQSQIKFVNAVGQWARVSETITCAVTGTDNLFQSILGNIFAGKLSTEWYAPK